MFGRGGSSTWPLAKLSGAGPSTWPHQCDDRLKDDQAQNLVADAEHHKCDVHLEEDQVQGLSGDG